MTESVGTYKQVPTVHVGFLERFRNCLWLLLLKTKLIAPGHFSQHSDNVLFHCTDVGFNDLQGTWRLIAIEIAVEVDLVTHDDDLAIFFVSLGRIDPGVQDVMLHLPLKERLDVLAQWQTLGVSQIWVWLRVALLVFTNCCRFVLL